MFYKIENFYYTEKLKILSEIQNELIQNYKKYSNNEYLEINWLKFFFQKNNLSFELFQEKVPTKEIKIKTVHQYLDSLK